MATIAASFNYSKNTNKIEGTNRSIISMYNNAAKSPPRKNNVMVPEYRQPKSMSGLKNPYLQHKFTTWEEERKNNIKNYKKMLQIKNKNDKQ